MIDRSGVDNKALTVPPCRCVLHDSTPTKHVISVHQWLSGGRTHQSLFSKQLVHQPCWLRGRSSILSHSPQPHGCVQLIMSESLPSLLAKHKQEKRHQQDGVQKMKTRRPAKSLAIITYNSAVDWTGQAVHVSGPIGSSSKTKAV